jgi:hypothetical protein
MLMQFVMAQMLISALNMDERWIIAVAITAALQITLGIKE